MKHSFKLSFSGSVFLLFLTVLVLTVSGTLVNTAAMCVRRPLGRLPLVHTSVVGIASVLMLVVFRKAWREQREQGYLADV